METRIVLKGDPIALQRARLNSRHDRIYDPQAELKAMLRFEVERQQDERPMLNGPLLMDLTFFMKIPKSMYKNKAILRYHFYKPDSDNMIKFYCDLLTGRVYKDDCQVAIIHAAKIYDDGLGPRVEIRVGELNNMTINGKSYFDYVFGL